MVQYLRFCLSMKGVRVQFLVGELTSHMPQGPKKPKTSSRSNTVTNSLKTLKMVHIKII